MTEWANLPNAAVIDRILADGKSRPEVLEAAYADVRNVVDYTALAAAWSVARDADHSELENAAMSAGGSMGNNIVCDVVTDAVYALIAWPSSADLLTLTPDALRTIIDTCDGDVKHQAVLLLPAVIARSTI